MVSGKPRGIWFGLGGHYLTSMLNGGLSVINNQYHGLLLRRSEGKYKLGYRRRHNKAGFRR